jgi:hypothetical protein
VSFKKRKSPKQKSVEHSVKHNAASILLDSIAYSRSDTVKSSSEQIIQSKGNTFPFELNRSRVDAMNRRLTELQIRVTCCALLGRDPDLTGRQLRKELKHRFGAVGKTERVFEVWRDETEKLQNAKALASLPTEVAELQRRLAIAEAAAAENLKRAELAEYRERAHQDHWAMEIDRLKQQLQSQVAEAGQGASRPFRV